MSDQSVTPELRQWITDQAAAGMSSDDVLEAMLASGWHEAVAVAALEETLAGATPTALPPRSVVPDPLVDSSAAKLWAGDREVQVLATLGLPRVVVFGSFLADDECDGLIELAARRLARSETVQTETGASEVNEARTSEGMFFGRCENALCERVEKRIASLLRWPLENGEGLQVLRYRRGAEYKPHYDYFDPAQAGTRAVLQRGGQRVASMLCYLNTPVRGGATTFPDATLAIAAVKGNAVFFSYDRPHPSTRSLHGGAPVLEGDKWVATKWLREGHFE